MSRIPAKVPVLQHGGVSIISVLLLLVFYFLFRQKKNVNVSKRAVHIALSIILVL